jgi:hypothetical protein
MRRPNAAIMSVSGGSVNLTFSTDESELVQRKSDNCPGFVGRTAEGRLSLY